MKFCFEERHCMPCILPCHACATECDPAHQREATEADRKEWGAMVDPLRWPGFVSSEKGATV